MPAFASPSRFSFAAVAVTAALALPAQSVAARKDVIAGPIEARVIRVVDGDTFLAEARIWPRQTIEVSVRIRGIDAPELRSRCAAEKAAAERSRAALEELIASGPVTISNVGGGKYYGRVLADVATKDGVQVATALLEKALVRVYRGGRRVRYCE